MKTSEDDVRRATAQVIDYWSCDGRFQGVRVLDGEEVGATYFLDHTFLDVGSVVRVRWWFGDQFAKLDRDSYF